jgi:EAL domain-containing protein (putative c-di-GMP-specific phosphodiesterase class I)
MEEPFELDRNKVFVTMSLGIALSTHRYERPDDVLRDADMAMYRAKAAGTGRHEMFDVSMHEQAVSLLRLQTELHYALEQHDFRVHYQPIVSLQTGRISGFEALVRWQHPERGFILPSEFIPVAEDTGLLIAIDRWVLGEACRQTHIWHRQFTPKTGATHLPLTISVNLTSKQFAQNDLIEHVEGIVRQSELEPRSLKLEITEGAIMENAESAAALLLELKRLGLQLSIDDFGTGYSSLSYLHRFPFDILKIDRSFVSRLDSAAENIEIIQAIITLARNLGLEVVAEGIETAEQLAQLRRLGCDYGQGYFFSEPVPKEDASVLLEQNPRW